MDRSLQLAMFEAALDSLAEEGEFINQGIEASASETGSEQIEIVCYTLPVEVLL
jgi:hypothetical protein